MSNRTWITVSGTVKEANAGSFQLDYGDGTLGIEMDDWKWYREEPSRL